MCRDPNPSIQNLSLSGLKFRVSTERDRQLTGKDWDRGVGPPEKDVGTSN